MFAESQVRAYTLLATIVAAILLSLFGCDQYPVDEYGEIPMDEWCYRSSDMPWTGCWEEVAQLDCTTGDRLYREEMIGELRLKSDGGYSITRHPFEHFVDYTGTYEVNRKQIVFSSIYTPGFDGEGTYSINEEGELLLQDVQFDVFATSETSDSDTSAISCGYVFNR